MYMKQATTYTTPKSVLGQCLHRCALKKKLNQAQPKSTDRGVHAFCNPSRNREV